MTELTLFEYIFSQPWPTLISSAIAITLSTLAIRGKQ